MLTFKTFQDKVSKWAVVSQIGGNGYTGLQQAVDDLRSEQRADKERAVGSVILFLTYYCVKEGLDLDSSMDQVWDILKRSTR